MLRHTELNTDIVTWTRLMNRAAPTVNPHIDSSASPMAIASQEVTEGKSKHQHAGRNDSPPSSPLTSHSGESTPKSPNTPSDLEKDEGAPINGELPPPMPISEEDLVQTNRINDHPIIPPPREFLGSAEDLARRRASEGSLIQSPLSSGTASHSPAYLFSHEGGTHPMRHQHQPQQQQPQHHHTPHYYHHAPQQHNTNMATVREVSLRVGTSGRQFKYGWAFFFLHNIYIGCGIPSLFG